MLWSSFPAILEHYPEISAVYHKVSKLRHSYLRVVESSSDVRRQKTSGDKPSLLSEQRNKSYQKFRSLNLKIEVVITQENN